MSPAFTNRIRLLVGVLVVMTAACSAAERPGVGLTNSPPEVTILNHVPTYTQAASLTLNVKAEDAVAVKQVWCSVNNGSAISAARLGAPEDRTWTCTADLAPNSANVVAVWAEDVAGHSGASGKPPYMQVLTVVHDDAALGVALNGAAQPTYYDESKMTVGTATPPVYDRNGVGLEMVSPGETIHKASTRLVSRTFTTSPSDLEGANPDNLPWLQFAVSLTGSPLATATYAIDATAGGTTKTYSGDLIPWRSPQSSAGATSGNVYFDLPLDSARIPLLTTVSGPVSLKVTVEVTNEAGNQGGDQVLLTYQVIGPPLNIAVDPNYAAAGARNSSYPYKIADGTYGTLFNGGDVTTFGGMQQVRLVRLVVTNPAPDPVALDVSSIATGTWTMTETWPGNQNSAGTYAFNDSTCPGDNQFAKDHASPMYAPLGGSAKPGDPGAASMGWTGVAATANVASLAELRDGTPLAPVGSRYIVPAAVGSAPGVVSLYVTRPLAVSRVAGAPALGASPYRNDRGTLYIYASERGASSGCCVQGYLPTVYYACISSANAPRCGLNQCEWYSTAWHATATHTYCQPGIIACPVANRDYSHPGWWLMANNNGPGTPCTNCTGTCFCSQYVQAQVYNLATYYQQLSTATEGVSLSLAPVTQPTDEKASLYGVANAGAATIAVNSSFDH